jgi:hypothetical protein
MALFSVHLRDNDPRSIAGAEFVSQHFSWKAFFFGPLWLLGHRLWAGFVLWIIGYVFLIVALATGISAGAGVLIILAMHVLLGLEASRLQEGKLASQGYHLVDIIAAPALEEAEVAFYRRFAAPDDSLAKVGAQGGAGP